MTQEEPKNFIVVQPFAYQVPPTGTPMAALEFCHDGSVISYSNQNGIINIMTSYEGTELGTLSQSQTNSSIASMKFHPADNKYILSAHRDGYMFLTNWQTKENKYTTRHLGSNLLCMDIDVYGDIYAIACSDGSVRIYNANDLQRVKALVKMTQRTVTNSVFNIYGLVFHPEDSNVVLAAGWNERVIFWDVRTGNPERTITGPHIRGPGLDIHNDTLITVSAKDKKQIEFWDYGTAKKIKDISIEGQNTIGNSVKIAANGVDFIVGTSGTSNEAHLFELSQNKSFGHCNFEFPLTSCAMSPFGSSFIVGTESGGAHCYMIRVDPQAQKNQ